MISAEREEGKEKYFQLSGAKTLSWVNENSSWRKHLKPK